MNKLEKIKNQHEYNLHKRHIPVNFVRSYRCEAYSFRLHPFDCLLKVVDPESDMVKWRDVNLFFLWNVMKYKFQMNNQEAKNRKKKVLEQYGV